MDFVYICKSGENEELRYSIRSVLNNFPDVRIWVVGGRPGWYSGEYIEISQNHNKYTNAFNNLIAICNSKEISDSFVFMNDDFFILKSFDLKDTFHGGALSNKIERYTNNIPISAYTRKLIATQDMLKSKNIDNSLDYELHVPMVVEKSKLLAIIKKYPSLLWRSMYGNLYSLNGIEIKDVKVYSDPRYSKRSKEIDKDSVFVSTEDNSFKTVHASLLKNMFFEPTRFEK